jgi:hypothetical protein
MGQEPEFRSLFKGRSQESEFRSQNKKALTAEGAVNTQSSKPYPWLHKIKIFK